MAYSNLYRVIILKQESKYWSVSVIHLPGTHALYENYIKMALSVVIRLLPGKSLLSMARSLSSLMS